MQVEWKYSRLFLFQSKLNERLLAEYDMQNWRKIDIPMEINFQVDEAPIVTGIPYRKLVCSLMYLAITTRPDLAFSLSCL